jgi:hypothetical protein
VQVCCDVLVMFVVRRDVKLFAFHELYGGMTMIIKMALD